MISLLIIQCLFLQCQLKGCITVLVNNFKPKKPTYYYTDLIVRHMTLSNCPFVHAPIKLVELFNLKAGARR